MNDNDIGRFGVVGGRGELAYTVVDSMTHEWVHTFENKSHPAFPVGRNLDNPDGPNTALDKAWRMVRKLNAAWREERLRRLRDGVLLTEPWQRPEVKV